MFLDRVIHFCINLGDQVKGRFAKTLKIVDRGSICRASENTGSKPQYEPFLFSVACSKTELSISGKFLRVQGKCRLPKKLKSLIEFPYVAHLKVQVLSFNMILISSP